jgi:hypothetical protein
MDESNVYSLIPYFKDNYEVVIIFSLLIIEFLLRKIPSQQDNSIVNKIIRLFDYVIKNHVKDDNDTEEKFFVNKSQKIKK